MSESAVVGTGTSSGWGRRALSIGDLVPQYGALDGTWIVSVLMPVYFGVVNGDVVAGLIMLATVLVGGAALRSRPRTRLVTGVLGRAAVVAIAFGFLYGEYFNRSLGAVALSRIDAVTGFTTVAAALLAVQLVANLAVGAMRSTGAHRRDDAWAPAAHFALLAGAALVAVAVVSLVGALIIGGADAIVTWLAVETVPDGVDLAIFYLLGAAGVAGAALLAESALARIDS